MKHISAHFWLRLAVSTACRSARHQSVRRTVYILLLAVGLSFPASETLAQAPPESAQDEAIETLAQHVTSGFESGDARHLLQNAADRVEISLFGTRTFYSRGQAFYVVDNFFQEYGPRRFALQDTVETDGSSFLTGRYWHVRTDRPLQVFIRMGETEEQWKIQEVRIESSPQ